MTTTLAVFTCRLTDEELLARVHSLARDEQGATAILVAHLAELDERRLHVTLGYSSLFLYCTKVLHLSEYEAFVRIRAARTGRKFPVIFEMLASGEIHLTAVRLLAPHLTPESHRSLLARAVHRGKRDVERLVAEISPQPDVREVVRKLPSAGTESPARGLLPVDTSRADEEMKKTAATANLAGFGTPQPATVAPLAPERYKVQFTADAEFIEELERLQELLRHPIPDGNVATILKAAMKELRKQVEKSRFAAVQRPREMRVNRSAAVESRGERNAGAASVEPPGIESRTSSKPSVRTVLRAHIPAEVRRQVWKRDGGCCTYRSPTGRRCGDRGFLEFHHLEPVAVGGRTTADNLALRCRTHNRTEAEITFGRRVVERAVARRGIPTGSGTS